MFHRIRLPLVAAIVALLAGCASKGTTTAPTPAVPNVAGSYSGSVTVTYHSILQSITCPATTTVTQSGTTVTMAPLMLGGQCQTIGVTSVTVGTFTISSTGSLDTRTVANVSLPSCGSYSTSATGAFSGSTLQLTIDYTAITPSCIDQVGNFTYAGTLTKSS
jgi:hypothetical protein